MAKKRVRLTKFEKQKKTIRTALETIRLDDLEGDPREAGEYLISLAEENSKYDSLRLEELYDFDEPNELVLYGFTQETDKEYLKRIEKLKKDKRELIERQEKVERKLHKQLLKKYGDK